VLATKPSTSRQEAESCTSKPERLSATSAVRSNLRVRAVSREERLRDAARETTLSVTAIPRGGCTETTCSQHSNTRPSRILTAGVGCSGVRPGSCGTEAPASTSAAQSKRSCRVWVNATGSETPAGVHTLTPRLTSVRQQGR
jgi:hypothetical protein